MLWKHSSNGHAPVTPIDHCLACANRQHRHKAETLDVEPMIARNFLKTPNSYIVRTQTMSSVFSWPHLRITARLFLHHFAATLQSHTAENKNEYTKKKERKRNKRLLRTYIHARLNDICCGDRQATGTIEH